MFQTFLVQPIYNAFIFILGAVPQGDVGMAIIILTLLVRAIFYPMFASAIRTQMAMQTVQPELSEINTKYKDDTMERSRRTAELFKMHRIRPLSLIFSTVVQVVFFIALSYAFFSFGLPNVRADLLYSFVQAPSVVNQHFLGFLDLTTNHHLVLTAIIVASQYLVIKLSLSRTQNAGVNLTPQQRAAQTMQRRMMLYMFPAMMVFIAYSFPGAVGLYLAVSNAVSLAQEALIRRKPL